MVSDGWAGLEGVDTTGWPACRFFGVFDGHSGDAASELVSTTLWPTLRSGLVDLLTAAPTTPSAAALEAAMQSAFATTDERVLADAAAASSGSTASVALVLGDALCVANLGDSRTVLCRAERCAWQTEDHKPALASERARIEAAGGHVTTPRVSGQINVPRLNGVLSVSRGFGDVVSATRLHARPTAVCVSLHRSG